MKNLIQKNGMGVVFTCLAIVVVIVLQATGLLDLMAYKFLDFTFHVRGPLTSWAAREQRSADSLDVVLVDVDDESYRLLADLGWPWPRGQVWNRVISNLADAGAKVIVFDIQFDSRDSYTAKYQSVYGDNLPADFVDGDLALAEAVLYARDKGCEVVMASTIKSEPTSIPPQILVTPNDRIMTANPDHGLVDIPEDEDGFTRRYIVFSRMEHEPDVWRPSLGMKAVKYFADIPDSVNLHYDRDQGAFAYGPYLIPSYGFMHNDFLTNIYGPSSHARLRDAEPWGTFRRFPIAWILDKEDYDLPVASEDTDWMSTFDPASTLNSLLGGLDPTYEVPESPFKDKICIIGVSVEVIHDYKSTVFYNYRGVPTLTPGYEFHANAIQTILDQDFIRIAGGTIEFTDDSAWIQILYITLASILAFILLANFKPVLGGILILLEALILFNVGVGLFTNDQLWLLKMALGRSAQIGLPGPGGSLAIPLIPPLVGMALTYIVNVLYQFLQEQRDKYFLKNTFGTYISPDLIDKMYEEKQEPELGGEESVHTAYFTDIQSFSSFSEILTATELVELLNEYLTEMTDILLANHGTLDKYEGDAIVAFYGAPVPVERHEYMACLTAIQMQETLAKLRERWQNEGERWPDIVHQMQMRIGIASGMMVTGNMGSAQRMNYTMMGDVVNTAARLEASAKQYGIFKQVIKATRDACVDDFEWREIDIVKVVGKSEAVHTWELISRKGELPESFQKLLPVYEEALRLLRAQEWNQAREAFQAADKLEDMFPGRKSNPCRTYLARIEEYESNPPGDDWDGSYTLTSK